MIVSRKQSKNLKRMLTRAEYNDDKEERCVSKCNEPRCGTCECILTGNKLQLRNGKTWTIKTNMNCKATNIIYITKCDKCESFYVGTTENLRNRVTLHKQQINNEQYRHLTVS